MAKITPNLLAIETLSSDINFQNLPTVMKKKVKDTASGFKQILEEAAAKASAKDPLELTVSFEDVTEQVKNGGLIKSAVQTMLNSMKKLG